MQEKLERWEECLKCKKVTEFEGRFVCFWCQSADLHILCCTIKELLKTVHPTLIGVKIPSRIEPAIKQRILVARLIEVLQSSRPVPEMRESIQVAVSA